MIQNDQYCPWHVHTVFSILDGCTKIKDLVNKCKSLDFYGCTITDHGSMSGIVEMFQTCNKSDIKPLIGCEIYVNDNRDIFVKNKGKKKETKSEEVGDTHAHHLVVIAKNNEGYSNLLKIQNDANKEGFYRYPLSKNEIVLDNSSGLVVSTACLGSEFLRNLKVGKEKESESLILKYKESFGENFYLEIQVNCLEDQVVANQFLISMSEKHKIELILGNDAHYLDKGDHVLQALKMCSKTQWNLKEYYTEIEAGRFYSHCENIWLMEPREIKELKDIGHSEISDLQLESAMRNTYKVAESCNVELIDGEFKFPNFDQPTNMNNKDFFISECKKGFKSRMQKGEIPNSRRMEYFDRLIYEIEVITFREFYNYFLVLQEALQFVRDTGGRVGAGRGSSAGSLVCYCLGITNLDPIKYNLFFERFLNYSRGKQPTLKLEY